MGAHEFNHVRLTVRGDAIPGGMLTVDLDGTAGLGAWLWIGTAVGEIPFDPFGTLFLDLTSPWLFVPVGSIPTSLGGNLPDSTPPGLLLVFQALGFDSPTRSGNLSNVVEVEVQ